MAEESRAAAAFARRLQSIYGESLLSVVLYGSAARGDFRPGVSDLNVLTIVRSLELADLRTAAGAVEEWTAAGNPPPLMLTESEWRSSADVFPIEYSDIRDAHVVLAGEDPTTDLHIDAEHLRLQLERELRTAKIQLREGYLAAGESPESTGALLVRSFPTILTLCRAILRLVGEPVPIDRAAVVGAVARIAGFDAAPVLDVLRLREAGEPPAVDADGPTAAGYLAAVVAATRWLDGFAPSATPPDREI